MTLGPLTHSSPGSVTPSAPTSVISSPVAGSMSLHTSFGSIAPTELTGMSSRSCGIACDTGLSSLMP